MTLMQAQHHQVLRVIVQRIERLQAEAANRFKTVGGQGWLAHHGGHQPQCLAQAIAEERRTQTHVIRQHPAGALHTQTIKRITVASTVQSAGTSEDELTENRRDAVAPGGISGRTDGQKPAQRD